MNKLTTDILWLGYEDVTGLWEIPWIDADQAEDADTTNRSDHIDTFVGLIRSGLIEVVVGPDHIEFDDAERVTPDEASRVLQDPQVWRGSETGDLTVRYQTTDAGFAAYRKATGWVDTEEE